jgi:trehalose-6-phosphate synthase
MLLNKKMTNFIKAINKANDKRIELTSETLNNIKTVKLYSWEQTFLDEIQSRRDLQMDK